MTRTQNYLMLGALALAAAACSESATGPSSTSATSLALAAALNSTPVGYSSVNSSFAPSGDAGTPFAPHGDHGPGFGGMMGGGLGDGFVGGMGFGPGFGRGPFGDAGLIGQCTFSAQTGRITCDPVTFNGLTVVRSAAYTNSAGQAQSALDSTTNTINTQTSVSGTITFSGTSNGGDRDHHFHGLGIPGAQITDSIISATTKVTSASNRTVTGLAAGSTQRTVNGTSAGQETTTGTTTQGQFSLMRVTGDTTKGLVIPVQTTGPTYPTAGTVIRSMQATVTLPGQTAQSSSRREVVTYNGSSTATVMITQDGTTKTCTLPLPHGRPTCQ